MQQTIQQMRDDWDTRAREDARYYVAFGRLNQDDDEFATSGAEALTRIRRDYIHLPPAAVRERRFLEIGCGLGRLMLPIAADCGEIHGVDISPEMVARGRQRLAGIPHAHMHVTETNDLAAFADNSFDYVFSFAVFQHIPDRSLVNKYLDEAYRVLKPSGILAAQFNGSRPGEERCDTWVGIWVREDELLAHVKQRGWRVLSSEGRDTQYLWLTLRKPPLRPASAPGVIRIVSVLGDGNLPRLIAGGPRGFGIVTVEGLSDDHADSMDLNVRVGEHAARIHHIRPAQADNRRQIGIYVPATVPAGVSPVVLKYRGRCVSNTVMIEVSPSPPLTPRVLHVADGREFCLGRTIRCGVIQITMDGFGDPNTLRISIGGHEAVPTAVVCAEPVLRIYLVNVPVPPGLTGTQELRICIDGMELAPSDIEVVS